MSKASTQHKKAHTVKKKGLSPKQKKNGSSPNTGAKGPPKFMHDYKPAFYPTLEMLKEAFDMLNLVIFNNELLQPNFMVDDLDTEWGYFIPDEVADDSGWTSGEWTLGVRNEFPTTMKFMDVVLHEMVHVWQEQRGCEAPHHGRSFEKWASTAKEYGYNINV